MARAVESARTPRTPRVVTHSVEAQPGFMQMRPVTARPRLQTATYSPLLGEKSSGNQSSRAVKQQVAWQRNVAAKKRMEKVKRSNRGVNHASYEPVLVNETVGRKMTPRQEQCVGRALPLSG